MSPYKSFDMFLTLCILNNTIKTCENQTEARRSGDEITKHRFNCRKSLISLPQVAALHYNDCWYIAHHLLTLGHQFSSHLPIKDSEVPLTFVHQVPMIRQLGAVSTQNTRILNKSDTL